jgi:hypothetical protein
MDHTQATALALSSAGIAEAHLAQSAGSFNHLASFGIAHQGLLQPAERVVIATLALSP